VGELAEKRAWNHFQGSYGKRAWNHFNAGYGKRAWYPFNESPFRPKSFRTNIHRTYILVRCSTYVIAIEKLDTDNEFAKMHIRNYKN
jgi:hypothetical protein